MKAIIDSKRYDTDKAEKLAELPCPHQMGDFHYHETYVYRTEKGRFFLAGKGGAMSLWREPCGNGYSDGEGIRALCDDEARCHLELCGPDGMAAIERYFVIEDA